MNKKLKTILVAIAALFLLIGAVVYIKFFTNNTSFSKNELYVKIPTGSKFEDVQKIVAPYIGSSSGFNLMASLRSYNKNVKPGRFLFKKGMGNYALIASLRRNVPVKIAFNNQERLENVAQRIGSEIEADSLKLMTSFRDSLFLKKNGFTKENVIAMFIPNSYQFYWNTSADKFRDKMLEEYRTFWNKDPTIIYALKLRDNNFNQVIKRVLYGDLKINSPYNTYINLGLPPGPIAQPDISAIDAVLNPEKHDYIYFCASVEKFGYHEFATTFEQHQVNAKKYATWLNSTGTKR